MAKKQASGSRTARLFDYKCPPRMSRMANVKTGERLCCYGVERDHSCQRGFDKHTDLNDPTWNKCCTPMDLKSRIKRRIEMAQRQFISDAKDLGRILRRRW